MATLKHDAQGFLVGDAIDLERSKSLAAMRNDVRAIRAGVAGIQSLLIHAQVVPRVGSRAAVVPQSAPRADLGRRPASGQPPLGPPAVAATSEVRAARTMTHHTVAQPRNRDSRGRFIGNSGQSKPQPARHPRTAPGAGAGEDEADEGHLHDFAERLVGAIKESSVGMEEADPAIKAFREIAQPMARGYELLTGGNKQARQQGWLRRIYGSLTRFRKDESVFNKVTAKRLKSIDEKPASEDGGGGKGLLGMLVGLLKRIPGVGAVVGGAGALLSRGGGLLAGVGRATLGAGRGLLGIGRGALRRLPLIGALLSGVGAASDIYDAETDDTLTRRRKDRRDGSAVGGFAGSMGGMLAGAKLGTMAGALAGPIGAAIGGIVGGAAGMFFGGQAGKIIGDQVGGWVNDLRDADILGKIGNGWNEVKVAALGTWDWVKSGWDSVVGTLQKGWDAAMSAFSAVGDTIENAWDGFVDTAKAGWKSVAGTFSSFYEGLKSLPGVGPAIKAAEAGTRNVAKVASTAKDGAVDLGGKAFDAVRSAAGTAWNTAKNAAGSAWSGAKDFAASVVPRGLKDRIAARRAMETGADYKQGNIAGLDDAHTRALVASTAATESAGGKLDVVNSAGYMGRYQAGASWLADAGLIKGGSAAVRAAMKADGFANEYKWGRAGGMAKFLKNADNWNGGLDYGKYLSSADTQDAAFKANSDKSYSRLLARGVITKDMSQDEIAGLLKARHIAGEGGAAQVVKGGTGPTDANGTTARKYFDDLKAGNAFTTAFESNPKEVPAAPSPTGAPSAPLPTASTAPVIASANAPAMPMAPAVAAGIATPTMPIVASARMPKPPTGPAVPAVAEAPRIDVPLASNDSRKPVVIASSPSDVGQDLRERGIAHIVTGGLGA